jgi:hypothetical protein
MISPRFADTVRNANENELESASHNAPPVHIHLHLPHQLTAAIMELVTALTGQRSLFSDDQFSPNAQYSSTQAGAVDCVTPQLRPAPVPPGEQVSPDGKPSVNAAESMLEFYRTHIKSRRQRAAGEAAIAEQESGMRAFDRFFEAWRSEAGDDPKNLRFVTPKAFLSAPDGLSMFSMHLITVDGLSPATVIKRLTNMMIVAKSLKLDVEKPTPEEVKRIHAEHLKRLQETATGQGVKDQLQVRSRRIPSWTEIDSMAKAVGVARYPYGDHAPYFWRGWIRFLAYIGPRARDVVSVIKRKPGLLKEHVILDSLCPVEDVSNALGRPLHSPHGWLHYPIGKDQHSENRLILFPMPLWMRNWLRFWMELSPCNRVFPSVMGKKIGFLSQKQMTREWNAIAAAAGVDARIIPSEGTGNRIALRKFAANWWALETLQSSVPAHAALSEKMENYVLHHLPKSTSQKHYTSDQAKLMPVMLDLMSRFPIPAGDAPPVSMLPE